MKRFKTLLFQSYQLFKDWYLYMKQRFTTLKLSRLNTKTSGSKVLVTITY
jgi:hypothetical protein